MPSRMPRNIRCKRRASESDTKKSASAPNVILVFTDNAARADTTEAAALREIWAASAAVDAMVVSSAPLWDG